MKYSHSHTLPFGKAWLGRKACLGLISLFLLPIVGGGQSCLYAQSSRKTAASSKASDKAASEKRELLERKMESTEQVVFLDSLVLPKNEVLSKLALSSENGVIQSYSTYFNTPCDSDCTVFKSQLGNKIIYSKPSASGKLRLLESDLIGSSWSEGTQLKGLPEDDSQNYPYMLSDGATLYYAARGEESLGGYDIYMSRYDADTHQFLAPENIGMPFNSTANDYLYVVDEFYQLGWFVTDRNQRPDSVCIYCFVPNTTRLIYNTEEIGSSKLRSLAMLNSIRDTWTDQERVDEGQKRLQTFREDAEKKNNTQHDFDFVINDKFTYTTLSQFRNPTAKTLANEWLKNTQELTKITSQLSELRDKYASTSKAKRQSLHSQIVSLEEKENALLSTIHQQEKQIRSLELN